MIFTNFASPGPVRTLLPSATAGLTLFLGQRTRRPLNAKGTRVWASRAHRTAVRNLEHRAARG